MVFWCMLCLVAFDMHFENNKMQIETMPKPRLRERETYNVVLLNSIMHYECWNINKTSINGHKTACLHLERRNCRMEKRKRYSFDVCACGFHWNLMEFFFITKLQFFGSSKQKTCALSKMHEMFFFFSF